MPDSTTPRIDVVNLASDDDLWVAQTDQNTVLQILANPVGWVSANVTIGGSPGVLWQPFVTVFQQISATGSDPTVLVQGINKTALLTIQYAPVSGAGVQPTG